MKIYPLMILTFVSFSAFAQESAATVDAGSSAKLANINKGDWSVASSATMNTTKAPGESDSSYANVSLEGEYHLANRVSVGLGFAYQYSKGDSVSSMGPQATYYFWSDEKLASFVTAGIRFGLTSETVRNYTFTALGLDYFISPEVAVGPSLYFNHYTGHHQNWDKYGMAVNFSIHL